MFVYQKDLTCYREEPRGKQPSGFLHSAQHHQWVGVLLCSVFFLLLLFFSKTITWLDFYGGYAVVFDELKCPFKVK